MRLVWLLRCARLTRIAASEVVKVVSFVGIRIVVDEGFDLCN